MAKQSGLGDQLFIDGYDISGDVGQIDRVASPSGVLDVTTIKMGGHERIHSHIDGELTFRQFWNDAALADCDPADGEHVALKAKGSGEDRVACYFHGSTVGNVAAGIVAKQINYDWERGQDGSLSGPTQLLANGFGVEWGQMLTPGKRTDSGADEGDSLDNGAATATGLAAYLQVFAFDGTDATVKVQHSSDDGGCDAYADLVTFTPLDGCTVDAPYAERKATALDAAVEQYLIAVSESDCGFCNLEFAVMVTREVYQA